LITNLELKLLEVTHDLSLSNEQQNDKIQALLQEKFNFDAHYDKNLRAVRPDGRMDM
jgi:hypothetical protein